MAADEGATALDVTLGRRLDDPRRRLDVGPNDIILDCSPEAADWLGVDRAALIGVHVQYVERAMARRFGPLVPDPPAHGHGAGPDVDLPAEDVVVRDLTTVAAGDRLRLRTVGVAVRDRAGWIERVVLGVGRPAERAAP